jgi:uncharacterized YccA/Bax inhibitor family protein
MASSNPAFNAKFFAQPAAAASAALTQPATPTAAQLDELYGRPSAGPAQTDRMSYEDTIVKTLVTFVFVIAGATVGFFFPALYLPFMFVALGLALVNIFKKAPSAPLVLAYGAAEGVFLGGISRVVENVYPGIIFQALIGTAVVFTVTLVLFANGKVRASKRATQIFMIAGISYALFSLVNLVLQFTGVANDPWGLYGAHVFGIPLGLIIGPLVILMAAYSLVLDFTSVKLGVEQGAPRVWGWKAAFGLVLTIVWLYIEILRLLAIFRSN